MPGPKAELEAELKPSANETVGSPAAKLLLIVVEVGMFTLTFVRFSGGDRAEPTELVLSGIKFVMLDVLEVLMVTAAEAEAAAAAAAEAAELVETTGVIGLTPLILLRLFIVTSFPVCMVSNFKLFPEVFPLPGAEELPEMPELDPSIGVILPNEFKLTGIFMFVLKFKGEVVPVVCKLCTFVPDTV